MGLFFYTRYFSFWPQLEQKAFPGATGLPQLGQTAPLDAGDPRFPPNRNRPLRLPPAT